MNRLTTTLAAIAAGAALVTGGMVSQAVTPPPPSPVLTDCSSFPSGNASSASPRGALPGVCAQSTEHGGYPTLDTASFGTDIPRCASDDFNADHVPMCYTERVTDSAVIIIDGSDTVVATVTGH